MEDGSTLFQEFAKEEASMAAAPLSSPAATAASMPGAADGSVDAAEVGQLRKRLQDLEEIADSRENRISGVSEVNWFCCCSARQTFLSFAPSFPSRGHLAYKSRSYFFFILTTASHGARGLH